MNMVDNTIRRHPARHELFAYAEMLSDRKGPIPGALASHVASCAQCGAEVRAMRQSLEFVGEASGLDASEEFTSRLLLDARRIRHGQARSKRRQTVVFSAVRGMAYAAALLVVSVITFAAVLGDPDAADSPASMPEPVTVTAGAIPAASIEKTAEQVKTLSAAVRKEGPASQSLRVQEQLRAVNTTDADIEAARQALERNPGNTRAAQIVQSSLTRQAETLRDLYVERSL